MALPKLLRAATQVLKESESDEDLRLLIAPGSSVGGARPKASVRGLDGTLYIAKFSRPDDAYDVNAWEHVALVLAKNASLRVANNRLERVARKSTLIVERFDRANRKRIPFVSAMTLVGGEDIGTHSYLEINEALRRYGTQPKRDLLELWKRMAFNVAISNTDDHLRNHGFLWRGDGWELSPCYDLNPVPRTYGSGVHALLLDDSTGVGDLELVMSLRERFNVSRQVATEFRAKLKRTVQSWERVAKRVGVSKRQIAQFESAFLFA
ncbi:MAG: HipA domain-containing protein [Myxococcota bacterium]